MFVEYVWLVPLIPVLSFVIVGFFGNKTPQGGGYITVFGAAASFIIALLVSYEFFTSDEFSNPGYITDQIDWFAIGGLQLHFGYYVDALACLMMLFASFISTLIFVYSLGYMGDQGIKKRRYFAEVALFLTGMLGLAASSNMVEMFVFWEIMGLCSYLLIGFWSFEHPSGDDAADNAASAAKKAFLVTRAGDVCLMAGMFVLFQAIGSLDYVDIFNGANLNAADPGLLSLSAFLIFGGAIGKSAQFPLMDWLPDAMAGPTTVSALIHAATMVKAGVYIVARCFPLFCMDINVMLFVGIIGGVTAFFAATMAMNNMNIKKVLAYSTLSQLGYMFLSLGAGGYLFALGMKNGDAALMAAGSLGYTAGILHMANHAFFKALLFLCSGSVIHSCGTEDMRYMGGMGKKMPITSVTMLIGSLSIAGFPFFAGFWSKDLVLDTAMDAFHHGLDSSAWIFMVLWFLGVVTAFMTAFYMFRLWFMTFRGEEHENALHCHGESPNAMTMPLCVLSIFAVVFGFTLLFGFDGLFSITYTAATQVWQIGNLDGHTGLHFVEELFTNVYTYLTIVLVLIAIGLAFLMYCKKSINPGKFSRNGESALYKTIQNRWYMPEIYNQVSWKLGYGVAKMVNFFDTQVIDGSVNGLSGAVVGGGEAVSKAQDGNVHTYAGVVVAGIIILFVAALALCFAFEVI
ncbi:proton-translocating NADH-quinone oxidoreductase, chain L [Thermoplasmatales archaeon BRNA1]|nr:proton-translocating NADH-quinone oxidoreductase, chain L [Thermoplasmatales archaeon BRNA1]